MELSKWAEVRRSSLSTVYYKNNNRSLKETERDQREWMLGLCGMKSWRKYQIRNFFVSFFHESLIRIFRRIKLPLRIFYKPKEIYTFSWLYSSFIAPKPWETINRLMNGSMKATTKRSTYKTHCLWIRALDALRASVMADLQRRGEEGEQKHNKNENTTASKKSKKSNK